MITVTMVPICYVKYQEKICFLSYRINPDLHYKGEIKGLWTRNDILVDTI